MNMNVLSRGVVDVPALRRTAKSPLVVGIMLALGGLSAPAGAASFELDENTTLNVNTTVRYGTAWRLKDQDPALLTNPNADDGNRNFDKGLVSNRFDLVVEGELRRGDFGAFVRGRGWYDDVYNSSNDHDSPATSNNASAPFNQFTKATEKAMGRDAELLDAFFYGSSGDLNFRVGKQIVNWGESLFVLGGGLVTSQNALDAPKGNIPGVEVKELLLPVGQGLVQARLTDNLSVEAYYQWDWEKTRLDPVGSYFSTTDLLDEGGEKAIGLPLTRGVDNSPRNSGQYGVALRYIAEQFDNAELGFYYVNYHDKLPQLNVDDATGKYNLDYVEDIHHFAVSAGTVIGGVNFGFELGHKTNAPTAIKGGPGVLNSALGLNYERAGQTQAQVSFVHVGTASPLWDGYSLLGEVAANRINGIDKARLKNDRSAWGYTLAFTPTYYAVAGGLDMSVPISFSQGVKGVSSVPATFSEKRDKLSVGLDFVYKNDYQFGGRFFSFLNSPTRNGQADRDFASLYVKTTF